jgi:heme O synthase-like polyprenyltransferase
VYNINIMSPFFVALILSAIITVVSLVVFRVKKENQSSFALKMFAISVVTIFGGLYFLQANKSGYPEIETGNADF